MFCPKCGEEMTVVNGTLTCVPGDMPLSLGMSEGLFACFIEKTRMPKETTFSIAALWAGETHSHQQAVSLEQLRAIARAGRLGTRVLYRVGAAATR